MYEKYFKPFTDLEYHYEIKNCLETAYEEGYTEGYAKGLAQGQREAVLMMAARKLKERGESVADIAELTGLAADEIAAFLGIAPWYDRLPACRGRAPAQAGSLWYALAAL
jgi:hypothetical protein